MEAEKINNFRKKVKIDIIFSGIILLAAVVFLVLAATTSIFIPKNDDHNFIEAFMKGFQVGVLIGLIGVTLYFIVTKFLALKNEETLKKYYIKKNDERKKMILQKTNSLSFRILDISLLFGSFIAASFSTVVFITLLAVCYFSIFINLAIYFIYSKIL